MSDMIPPRSHVDRITGSEEGNYVEYGTFNESAFGSTPFPTQPASFDPNFGEHIDSSMSLEDLKRQQMAFL
jgi:hypothetical protein